MVQNYFYVFGYGSLIWRPGDILNKYGSFCAHSISWKRVFAQRSIDHRGTPSFPGLVLNLVENNITPTFEGDDSPEIVTCRGIVWLVPEIDLDLVIEYLDEREKGGYSRNIIEVELSEATPFHPEGSLIKALVYAGEKDNPFFYMPLKNSNAPVEIIAAAHGPSGANCDYLLNLVRFLEAKNMSDEYLNSLASKVRLRIGPWRLADNHRRFPHSHRLIGSGPSESEASSVVVGWGSNEFGQLAERTLGHGDHVFHPIKILEVSARDSSFVDDGVVVAGGGTTALLRGNQLTVWGSLVSFLVPLIRCNDGGESGCEGAKGPSLTIGEVENVSIGHDHMLILLTSGLVAAIGNNSHGQCAGPEPLPWALDQREIELLPSDSAFVIRRRESVGSKDQDGSVDCSILKVSAGLRHSAAITADGRLFTWGDSSHRQVLSEKSTCSSETSDNDGVISFDSSDGTRSWRPPDGGLLVDVCCGATHTVTVDNMGRIWTFGSNKHGSLGRVLSVQGEEGARRMSGRPSPVQGLPDKIMWQRVTCGWSHAVARGVDVDGNLVFYGWGRRDMRQYLTEEDSAGPTWRLKALPSPAQMVEVWCGSEFTVAVDHTGRLWGCGWGEHGNLTSSASLSGHAHGPCEWTLMTNVSCLNQEAESNAIRLSSIWEGALSCGGSHVVAIVRDD